VEEAVAVTHQDILAEVGLLQSLEFLVKMHQFRMLTCCTSSLGGGGRSAVQLVNGTDAVDAAGGGGGGDCDITVDCGGGGEAMRSSILILMLVLQSLERGALDYLSFLHGYTYSLHRWWWFSRALLF
jgi:hypothetical protein